MVRVALQVIGAISDFFMVPLVLIYGVILAGGSNPDGIVSGVALLAAGLFIIGSHAVAIPRSQRIWYRRGSYFLLLGLALWAMQTGVITLEISVGKLWLPGICLLNLLLPQPFDPPVGFSR